MNELEERKGSVKKVYEEVNKIEELMNDALKKQL